MTSVSAGHIILTPTQPVRSGREVEKAADVSETENWDAKRQYVSQVMLYP